MTSFPRFHGDGGRFTAGAWPAPLSGPKKIRSRVPMADWTRRTSEELFRETFDRASVGKAQADPTTARFVRVNAALCEFLGYTDAELLQRTIGDVSYPDDRAADEAALPRLMRGEIPSHTREKRYLRRHGAVTWW